LKRAFSVFILGVRMMLVGFFIARLNRLHYSFMTSRLTRD
jgi:hypothetical protein